MKFFYSCRTDIGVSRESNQDSLLVKTARANGHTVLMAAVCDGVGGLSRGERTSRRAAELLASWFEFEVVQIMGQPRPEDILRYRFRQRLMDINREIYSNNVRSGISSATTLTALILWDYRFLVGHLGDSRLYRIDKRTVLLTSDHSWVANEVAMGRMTPAQAMRDKRQNIILKCIGGKAQAEPDILEGKLEEDAVFVLCTDGFWHHVSQEEWGRWFSPSVISGETALSDNLYRVTELVKRRGESDNITAIAIDVTCSEGEER